MTIVFAQTDIPQRHAGAVATSRCGHLIGGTKS